MRAHPRSRFQTPEDHRNKSAFSPSNLARTKMEPVCKNYSEALIDTLELDLGVTPAHTTLCTGHSKCQVILGAQSRSSFALHHSQKITTINVWILRGRSQSTHYMRECGGPSVYAVRSAGLCSGRSLYAVWSQSIYATRHVAPPGTAGTLGTPQRTQRNRQIRHQPASPGTTRPHPVTTQNR